jgi:CubicO group peptidase (beta-lactamase class C family)
MKLSKEQLQQLLDESIAKHNVPGVSAAILHRGDVVTAAAGVANVDTGVNLTPDTLMHIGSITKVFNATLVMQLVDEGLINLDERVVRYLPDLRLKDQNALKQMTVRMLLNHTSGIDGEILPDYGHDEETIEKGIARFSQLGQLFQPGTEVAYCNAATVIAGYLAQRLTNKSWYRLMREKIFEPLGMKHSAALPEEALLHRASVGHFLAPNSDRKLIRTTFAFLPFSFAPCGTTVMMSAGDLLSFARAHIGAGVGANGHRILSTRSALAMQKMTVNNEGRHYTMVDGFGIGWMVFGSGLLHHSGGGPGIGAVLYAHPQEDFAAVLLTNAAHSSALINELIAPWIEEFGSSKPLGVTDISLPKTPVSVNVEKYLGVFESVLNRYRVSKTPRGLAVSQQLKWSFYDNISTEEGPATDLMPLGGDVFVSRPADDKQDRVTDATRLFDFRNPDSAGRMQHLGSGLRLYRRVAH